MDARNGSIELPIASLSVAAQLKAKGYSVEIIDQRTDYFLGKRIRKEVAKKPLFFGVSSMTGKQILHGLDGARIAKEADAEVKVVWGGTHTQLMPEQTVANPLIDIVSYCGAESNIAQLAEAVQNSRSLDLVPGIVYKNCEKIIKTAPPEFVAYPKEKLPFELVDIKKYFAKINVGNSKGKWLMFVSSRGCPYRCTFCCNAALFPRGWQGLPAGELYLQTREMVDSFGLEGISFWDENFFGNPRRAYEFADNVRGDFKWSVQARMDFMDCADLGRLESGGLCSVLAGVESGSQRILDLMHKGEKVESIISANKKMSRTGISPTYNFIMGFPGETESDLFRSVDLALMLLDDNPNAAISAFNMFVPMPGTQLFCDLVSSGKFIPPTTLEGWAGFSRQNVSPNQSVNKSLFRNLIITSKLVNARRIAKVMNLPLPSWLFSTIGNHYKNRWRRKDFRETAELKVIRKLFTP